MVKIAPSILSADFSKLGETFGKCFQYDLGKVGIFNFIAVQLYVNHAGTDTMCFIIHVKYPPMCYTRYMNIRSHSNREESTCKEKLRFPII